MTPLFQTSEGQEVLEVNLSNGQTIKATPYHKWYVVKQDSRGKLVGEQMKRTHELQEGDKLIKFNLEPVTHGTKVLPYAYSNGFHTADGTVYPNGSARLSLYGNKQQLIDMFNGYRSVTTDNSGRINVNYSKGVLQDKFFVPDSSYSVQSRLNWLAGLFDGDGTLTNNQGTESIQLVSTNKQFLASLQLLLQELGINSKFSKVSDACYHTLPSNDGTGGSRQYWCKEQYRILIAGSSLNHLVALGYFAGRVMPTVRIYNREASQFVKVLSVVDNNEVAPTYCGTEPTYNKLMFNGVLTGNCMEITLPTKPMGTEDEEIALCTLAAINLGAIESLDELEHLSDLVVRGLDSLLSYQGYPEEAARKALSRRSLGVGVTNLAYYLAKNGVYYSNGSANNLVHRTMEALQYYLLKASNQLAIEQGACDYFNRTSYSQGILPIDRYKHDVDAVHTQPLLLDWEALRTSILAHGLRNSTVTAQMPCETSSAITNSTNGIEPARGLVTAKGSKSGVYNQVVPEVDTLHYELLWQIPDNTGYLQLVAIMQKFFDQSISANTNYDPSKFPDGKVTMNELLKDLVTAYKLGIKTLYYHNTRDGNNEEDEGCAGGACKL
jgi:ribonucleotide reductase alpha subunit